MARAVVLTGGSRIKAVDLVSKVGSVGHIDRVNDVSIKAFPCPKINDKGLTGAWRVADAVALGVTIWATAQSFKAAKEEYELGKRYFNLAKDTWDFFYKHYRPLEDQELDEIYADTFHTPDYPKAVEGHTGLIDLVFSTADKHRSALADKYCLCDDVSQFTKTDIMKSTVYGDSDNFARRYEEKLAVAKNDIRWSRMVSAASRGRGILGQSANCINALMSYHRFYRRCTQTQTLPFTVIVTLCLTSGYSFGIPTLVILSRIEMTKASCCLLL